MKHIVAQLQFGYHDQLSYRIARREVHQQLSLLSSVISNMHSEPEKYRQALQYAPNLLGMTSTLVSYISTLGAYRTESQAINYHMDFSAIFFQKAKRIIVLIERIAEGNRNTEIWQELTAIEQSLRQFELTHQTALNAVPLVLLQQLRLIVTLLPQLEQTDL